MQSLDWVTRVDAGVTAVARFHALPGTIRRLTPPVVPMTQHRMDPLDEGSVSEFTLWFGPLPVRWTALHIHVDPQSGFTDVQSAGPFDHWVHVHRFEPDPAGGTRIIERIDYQHATGWRGLITRTFFSKPMLYLLFTYRSWVFRRALRGPSSKRLAEALSE